MRAATIEVGWNFLLDTLRGHELTKVVTDIPPDARVLGVWVDTERDVIKLRIESASFADVPPAHVIPQFNPVMTVSVTEMSMLADLVSRRHEAWEKDECADCGKRVFKHSCPI